MEEAEHIIWILEETQKALEKNDSMKLKDLSNMTLHSASVEQDSGSITIAVLVYSIGKVLERKDGLDIKNWDKFVKRFNSFLGLAIKALKDKKQDRFQYYLQGARKSLSTISINLKPYIQEVFRKASINKASRIYEHGISLGLTGRLLGLTQWELSEYTGQLKLGDYNYNTTLDVKKKSDDGYGVLYMKKSLDLEALKIRKATLKDLHSVRSLNLQLFNHDYVFDNTLDLTWPAKNRNYYKKSIICKNSLTLVAEIDKKIVGYLIANIIKADSYRKIEKLAELENTLVASEYRCKNIGTKLVHEFIKWVKAKKIKRIRIVASAKNERAINFYKKNSLLDYNLILEGNI